MVFGITINMCMRMYPFCLENKARQIKTNYHLFHGFLANIFTSI